MSARRRDVSLHSRSAGGAHAMDLFTTIVQTSKLHGVIVFGSAKDAFSEQKGYADTIFDQSGSAGEQPDRTKGRAM